MSDDPVRTRVLTTEGWLDFQDYFVRRQCQPAVREFMFAGAERHARSPTRWRRSTRQICAPLSFVRRTLSSVSSPSSRVPGIRAAMQRSPAPVVAVTPIIGGKAIKGPAAKMMAELGLDVSAAAVARRYAGIIDGFVIDQTDPLPDPLPGITFFSAATLMSTTR